MDVLTDVQTNTHEMTANIDSVENREFRVYVRPVCQKQMIFSGFSAAPYWDILGMSLWDFVDVPYLRLSLAGSLKSNKIYPLKGHKPALKGLILWNSIFLRRGYA